MTSDLIARLEEATDGSRELDWLIAWQSGRPSMAHAREDFFPPFSAGSYADKEVPNYTTSIDAALTLVPEGMEFEITNLYGVARIAMGLNVNDAGPWYAARDDGNLALALCIAALKARNNAES